MENGVNMALASITGIGDDRQVTKGTAEQQLFLQSRKMKSRRTTLPRKMLSRFGLKAARIGIRLWLVAAGACFGIMLQTQTRLLNHSYDSQLDHWFGNDVIDRPTNPARLAVSTSSSAAVYRNRSQVSLEFNSTVQFVFTMGLEGTGHHFMENIVEESPAVEQLTEHGIWPDMVGRARRFLFQHYDPTRRRNRYRNMTSVGLWNAHCAPGKDPATLESGIVEQLKLIEETAKRRLKRSRQNDHASFADQSPLVIPVNTAFAEGSGYYGEISYPNFFGNCRQLNYPDLNLLYNACRKAKIDCLHVYIYRHPMEILNSIARRGFGERDASSMQMYIADLHIMAQQIRTYPEKTLGCLGFFETTPEDKRAWMNALEDLWKWGEQPESYNAFIDSVYKAPRHGGNMTKDQQLQSWLESSQHSPYVGSWWNVHKHTLQTCLETVRRERKSE